MAQWIFAENSIRHLGSRSKVDRSIVYLPSFRKVMVLDIREGLKEIAGLTTIVGDAKSDISDVTGIFPRVSSLHPYKDFALMPWRGGSTANAKIENVSFEVQVQADLSHLVRKS